LAKDTASTLDDVGLQEAVESLFAAPKRSDSALELLTTVRRRLSQGTLRVAEQVPATDSDGTRWEVCTWVKKAVLLMSALGRPVRTPNKTTGTSGVELDTMPWLTDLPVHCRMPPGSLVRDGAFIDAGVTCMPPSVIQIASHVGQGVVIDSMVTIGIGAQIGAGAQLSCGSIVGGWILPLEQLPTIVEEGVLMGSRCSVCDGAQIGASALLLAGTQILSAIGIYDLRTESMLPMENGILRVPPRAIIGMGTRPIGVGGAQLNTPILLGFRHGPCFEDWELYTDLDLLANKRPVEVPG
jgi:2,3,4,5-tetrahydropyridine-2-carboxylate N-succinyltransferase